MAQEASPFADRLRKSQAQHRTEPEVLEGIIDHSIFQAQSISCGRSLEVTPINMSYLFVCSHGSLGQLGLTWIQESIKIQETVW